MGCCGCTLQTSAIVAAVFGILESVAGFIAGSISASQLNYFNLTYLGNVMRNVFLSATVFNALWLVATIILIIGIVKENALMHRLWVGATSVIMIVDLAHTIALIVVIVNLFSYTTYSTRSSSYYYYSEYIYYDSSEIFLFVLRMTAISRGSVWLWIINMCLTIYTAHRANEIERGPVQPGTTVIVYGNQPVQPYPMAGQTVIVQHSGPMPSTYAPQQQQYGQPQTQYGQPQTQYGQPQTQYGQPQTQYGQLPSNPYSPDQTDQGLPPKY